MEMWKLASRERFRELAALWQRESSALRPDFRGEEAIVS